MVKIVAISDTHNQHNKFKIPECDILIHAGDSTGHGNASEVADFESWLENIPTAKNKLYIAGNHDFYYQNPKHYDPNKINYLRDSSRVLHGIKVYGTPWTPFFFDWAFNGLDHPTGIDNIYRGGPGKSAKPDKDHPLLSEVYGLIPEDTDVLVVHGPPRFKNLDTTLEGHKVGSVSLLKRILELPNLKVVICGHIHEGYGHAKIGNVDVYNVASLQRDYTTQNEPVVIEL